MEFDPKLACERVFALFEKQYQQDRTRDDLEKIRSRVSIFRRGTPASREYITPNYKPDVPVLGRTGLTVGTHEYDALLEMPDELLNDPWMNTIQILVTVSGYQAASRGPDGKWDTADDTLFPESPWALGEALPPRASMTAMA